MGMQDGYPAADDALQMMQLGIVGNKLFCANFADKWWGNLPVLSRSKLGEYDSEGSHNDQRV